MITIKREDVVGCCIFIFYACLTYWEAANYKDEDNDFKDELTLLPMAIKVGKRLINKYLYKKYLKQSKISVNSKASDNLEDKENSLTFYIWKQEFLNMSNNHYLNEDTFIAEFGCKLIDILEWSNLVVKDLVRLRWDETKYVLKIKDQYLLKEIDKNNIHILPFKLPMIVEPRDFSKNTFGGYILNGEEISDSLIIKKPDYKHSSEITDCSIIYELVNGISKVPYKINNELLNFLLSDNKLYLLFDPSKPHKSWKKWVSGQSL